MKRKAKHPAVTSPTHSPPAPLAVRLFGEMELAVGGSPCTGLRSKARWLLALLLLRRGRPIERALLAAQLWPDSLESRGLYNMRRELTALRRALGEQAARLQGTQGRIGFDVGGCWIDALEFDDRVASPAADDLARAVELYRGPLLEGCLEEWALPLRDDRQTACIDALERLVDHDCERSDLAAADRRLQALVALDPLNESAHRRRIRLLADRHEFAAAVQAFRELRLLLHRQLGVEPDPETVALYERIRATARRRSQSRTSAVGASLALPSRQLPTPLTSLVGRRAQLAELRRVIAHHRLVTLTGPPGVGKTRLALQAAAEFDEDFPDGVAFVQLAPLTDGIQLIDTLASALGLRGAPGMSTATATRQFLSSRRMLLVFDNCEHLPAAAPMVQELLASQSTLVILTTSRQSLGLPGETIVQVPPLALPDPESRAKELDAASRSAALRLFVERTALACAGFELDENTIGPAIEICRRLEGIPLCLELAAARARALSVAEILERLDAVMQGPGSRGGRPQQRHLTFHAALDWSHDNLSPPEQTLLRRLAMFAGSWSLGAVESVCRGDEFEATDVIALVDALIDNSMVQREEPEPGQSRYRLLEPVRQYARSRLVAAREEGSMRARHLAHFSELAQAAAPHLFGGGQDNSWPRLLSLDLDNLRLALRASEADPELAAEVVRLGTALQWYWFANGHIHEGRQYLADGLASATDLTDRERARALIALAYLAYWDGDTETMDTPLVESLAIHERLGDRWGVGYAGSVLAYVRGTRPAASATAEMAAAVAAARDSGDRTLISIAVWWQGMLQQHRGDLAAARRSFEEVLATIREQRHATGIGHALYPLARLALADGDLDTARRLFDESVSLLGGVGNEWGVLAAVTGLVEVAAARRDHLTVARLLGALEAGRERIGGGLTESEIDRQRRLVADARNAMDETTFEAHWETGRTMSWQDIVRDAHGEPEQSA
ncbi:MAG: AAA family ATPase [Planctomycetes bacterium]|nr:AAA family ATPase [Planctomycetota bacterium]